MSLGNFQGVTVDRRRRTIERSEATQPNGSEMPTGASVSQSAAKKWQSDEPGRKSPKNKIMTSDEYFIKCAIKAPQNLISGFTRKKHLAFSLIEIMVGLIVTSVMVAAFAPIITKKISYAGVSLLNSGQEAKIEDKVFTFQEAKDNIDGCKLSSDKLSLQCPFVIPNTNKINIVMLSPGGGGGGANSNVITTSRAEYHANKTYVKITQSMSEFKIHDLISAGGGGGGGYYKYAEGYEAFKEITSQEDCDSVYNNTYFYNGQCVAKKNLSVDDLDGSYGITSGSLVGFSDCSNYIDGDDINYVKIPKCYDSGFGNSEPICWNSTPKTCTKDAANIICSNYTGGNSYSKGHWSLVSSSSFKNLVDHFSIKNSFKSSGKNGCLQSLAGFAVPETLFVVDGSVVVNNSRLNLQYKCSPEYVWTVDTFATFLNDSSDHTFNCDSSNRCYDVEQVCAKSIDRRRCIAYSPKTSVYYSSAAFSVRCAVDKIWQQPIPEEKYTSSGGGGGAGAELKDIKIPDDVLKNNVGNYIVYGAGAGGNRGSNAGNGEASANGSDGEKSFIYIKTNYSYDTSGIKWGIEVLPGKGGKAGYKNRTAQGGSRAFQFRYFNGSSWTTYSNSFPNSLKTNTSTKKYFENASFILGSSGSNGISSSSSVSGGAGGNSPSSFDGGGGSGGSADLNGTNPGAKGTDGYIKISYNNIYQGASGSGGGGGALVKIESVPVVPDEVMFVTVGKGGKGGSVNSNGSSGGITSIKYNSTTYTLLSGGGGKTGTKATSSSNPIYNAGGNHATIPNIPTSLAPNSSTVFKQLGTNGEKGAYLTSDYFSSKGGMGGMSGINYYLHNEPNNVDFSKMSIPCGGLVQDDNTRCSLSDTVDASFTGSIFSYPNKIYNNKTTSWGQAGSGGGGGGVRVSPNQSGEGADGQNGYIYIWWSEDD